MALMDRLISPLEGEIKIPVHTFMAAIAELDRGEITITKIVQEFNISVADQTALTTLVGRTTNKDIDRAVIHDVLLLAEGGFYTLREAELRLMGI